RPAREELEVLRGRRAGTRPVGRLPEGVLADAVGHQHPLGAVVCDPGGPQVVRADLRRRGYRAHPDRDRPAVPGAEQGPAPAAAGRQARAGGRGAQGRPRRPVRREGGRGEGEGGGPGREGGRGGGRGRGRGQGRGQDGGGGGSQSQGGGQDGGQGRGRRRAAARWGGR